jgi:hypothetical protein
MIFKPHSGDGTQDLAVSQDPSWLHTTPRIWLHSMGSLERHIRVGTRLHHSARSAATAVLDL